MYVCPIPKFVGGGTFDIVSPIFQMVGGHVPLSTVPPGFAPMYRMKKTKHYLSTLISKRLRRSSTMINRDIKIPAIHLSMRNILLQVSVII